MFTREELIEAHDHFMALSAAAQQSGDWAAYCAQFTDDAVYVEHFLGTMRGRAEITGWLVPAMSMWPQMTFPMRWRTFNENEGLVVFSVGNDMPDVDGNGPYSVESWQLLRYAGNHRWRGEEDIYNPDAMLKMLVRWCEAAGVEFPTPEVLR